MSGRTNGCCSMCNCEKKHQQTRKHQNFSFDSKFGPTENQMISLKMYAGSRECGGSVRGPAPHLDVPIDISLFLLQLNH